MKNFTPITKTITEYNGYKLIANQYAENGTEYYAIEQSQKSLEMSTFGLLSLDEKNETVEVSTTSFSDRSVAFVSEYVKTLKEAMATANYFNAVIINRAK